MIDQFFIFCANSLIYVAIVIFAIYFLRQPRKAKKKMLTLAVIVLPISYLVAKLGSHLFYSPRPFVGHFVPLVFHDADNGFPSDHVLLMASLASILIAFNKRLSIGFWFLTLLVAVARVYVGVHHSVDVIASIAIAFITTYTVGLILKRKYN